MKEDKVYVTHYKYYEGLGYEIEKAARNIVLSLDDNSNQHIKPWIDELKMVAMELKEGDR